VPTLCYKARNNTVRVEIGWSDPISNSFRGIWIKRLPEAEVVCSFNVLIYYDAEFRRKAEEWVAQILRPGGLLFAAETTRNR
jgi:chemotaxis methyl-accepting protein methylase